MIFLELIVAAAYRDAGLLVAAGPPPRREPPAREPAVVAPVASAYRLIELFAGVVPLEWG